MRVGVFQFSPSADIHKNLEIIAGAIAEAAEQQVRLLVFQECALCGYPPVEIESVMSIDFAAADECLAEVGVLAHKHGMYIALGNIRRQAEVYYNSMQLIGPDGAIVGHYDKRALWGWDLDNFTQGTTAGVFEIDGIKVGFRICFEIRFPEYFRELFADEVKLCFVSFCDVSQREDQGRVDIIRAHLVTRAVENVMTIISVNSTSGFQTAPTAVFSTGGQVIKEAPLHEEHLLVYDFAVPEPQYGAQGRIQYSRRLLGMSGQYRQT